MKLQVPPGITFHHKRVGPRSLLKARLGRLQRRIRRKLTDIPQGVAINISALCNLRCVMCSLETYGEKRNMSIETLRELEPVIRQASFVTLPISGEAFVHKQILPILERIRELTPGWLMLTTNGTLITEEAAAVMVKQAVDVVRVSLDGIEPETNARIRVQTNYAKTLAGIEMLVKARQWAGTVKPRLIISFCGMKSNVSEFPAVVELAARLGMDGVWMVGLEPFFPQLKDEILYGPDFPTYEPYIREAQAVAARTGLELRLPAFEITGERFCVPQPHITANGEVSPCCTLMYSRKYYWLGEERQHHKVVFGNIGQEKLSTIWRKPEVREFRRQVESGNFPPACDGCLFSHNVIERWK